MQLAKKASLESGDLSDPLGRILAIFSGGLLCAISFNGFFIPNQLLSGGVGGLAIMGYYLTNIPTGLLIFIMNVPLFIIGTKFIDKKFILYSFLSMVTMSFLLSITEGIDRYIQINDMLLEAIFGGILNGLGMGILFRNKASQGGMDIVAAIFKKKLNVNIGTALLGVNTIVIGSSSLLFGLRPAMYTMMALYISYQVVDKVQVGFDTKKTAIIISNKPQDLAQIIHDKLGRGSTFLNGEGAYKKDNKKIIYCTVYSTQVAKLKDLVEEIDSQAFITINDVEEVKGKGFKNIGI